MKILTKVYFLCFFIFLMSLQAVASEWQWSIQVKGIVSDETNSNPRAFLWIPTDCKQVRGVVVGYHNMSEEGIFEHAAFRKTMTELGLAVVWVTPSLSQTWAPESGVQQIFEVMMTELGDVSGYTELKYAPIVPIGHSAMASYPWNFGAFNPDRTLVILSIHGDAPRTHLTGYGRANVDWGNRNIEGIPSLMVMGEYEWWEDRLFTAFDYRRDYPDAPLSFLADAGHGHFDVSDELVRYLCLFLKKACQKRLPKRMPLDAPIRLMPISASQGWLADRWHSDQSLPMFKSAPYAKYKGDKSHAFWYFDKEMAEATERYYTRERGKQAQYIGFMQKGKLLSFNPKNHARISARFEPEEDGLTFHLSAAYTDTLRSALSNDHASCPIHIERICGPVEKVNDTTFTVRFYCMGLDNERRTGDIWLLARSKGDSRYKSTVQQLNLRIPYRQKEGAEQSIRFDSLPDICSLHQVSISLNAKASSGLPVQYYIKEGPAEIVCDKLVLTKIPPRTKYPIKVTVVAWQYGRSRLPKVQTAKAIERSFYIYK
jgi:hypothetical protein